MLIVTGASDNHFLTLIQFLKNVLKYIDFNKNKVIVYNLDINELRWKELCRIHNKIIFKTFDYSKYPSWFNININAGEYAWKPTIIYNTFIENQDEKIIWMDSGDLLSNDLSLVDDFLEKNYIYSAITCGTIKDWTHPKTINYMKPKNLKLINRNGAFLAFNCKKDWVKDFLEEFYKCAQDKNCIAPEGSSRKNHRQDQAVFTILYYKYKSIYNFKCENNYVGYTIHNDID